jgi:hypothetical protein
MSINTPVNKIEGVSEKDFTRRTRELLGTFNGSPIGEHATRQFLALQLGLSNEHRLTSLFRRPLQTVVGCERISEFFSAVEGATLTFEEEIGAYQALLRPILENVGEHELRKLIAGSWDVYPAEGEETLFTESDSVRVFFEGLVSEIQPRGPSELTPKNKVSMRAFFDTYSKDIEGALRDMQRQALLGHLGVYDESHSDYGQAGDRDEPYNYRPNNIFIGCAAASSGIDEHDFIIYAMEYFNV